MEYDNFMNCKQLTDKIHMKNVSNQPAKRDSFASSFGVLVAMAGSAVGLGNLWRFPYLVGENGGAAFILIYLGFVVLAGLPVMLAEFIIGRRSPAGDCHLPDSRVASRGPAATVEKGCPCRRNAGRSVA